MTTALDLPAKERYLTVLFTYGNPLKPVGYTDLMRDITTVDGDFVSTPTLEVEFPPNTGTFEDRPVKIAIPFDSFMDNLSIGIAHAPINCLIREYTEDFYGAIAADRLTPFLGRVTTSYRHYQGRTDKILLEARTIKQRLQFPVGVQAGHHCVWTLFGRGCGAIQEDWNGACTAIDGKFVTITGMPVKPDRFFHRGYVAFDGLNIPIFDWRSANPTEFILRHQPPASWVGETVTVVPGCDKLITTCRTRWNAEETFCGPGIAIPGYHPVFEDGAA